MSLRPSMSSLLLVVAVVGGLATFSYSAPKKSCSCKCLESKESDESACAVVFKGQSLTFAECQKGLSSFGSEGLVDVYYSLTPDNQNVDTLFRVQKTNGYVAMAWGYDRMIGPGEGTHAVVANEYGDVKEYLLESQSSSGVNQYTGTSSYTNMQGEVANGYISARFTRPVADPYQILPALLPGASNPFIWSYGSLSDDGSLEYHIDRNPEDGILAPLGRRTNPFEDPVAKYQSRKCWSHLKSELNLK